MINSVSVYYKYAIVFAAFNGFATAFIEDPDQNGSQEGVAVDMNGVVYTWLSRSEALRRYDSK